MPDPTSTTLAASPTRPGRRRRRLPGGRRAGPGRRVGESAVRAGRPPVVERSARRRGHRRAARLARRAGPLRGADRRARGVRRRGRRRGLHDRGGGRDGRQQPRPGRPPPDVRRPRRLPRPAHPRFDRSGLRGGDARRPRPAPDAGHHRLEVGHDHRAERLPRLRLGRAAAALDAVPHRRYEHVGAYFAAITDPGKPVEAIAHTDDFREVFTNPPDIGGRYSALTYVGLVPASLIGIDLDALLASASAMLGACREPDPATIPAVSLGLAIGTLGQGRPRQADLRGRRRDRELRGAGSSSSSPRAPASTASGSSRSISKPLGPVEAYGTDRAFVRLALAGRVGGAARRARSGARGRRPPGDPDRDRRPDRPRRRIRPLGGRDRDRRGRPGHRPVRPAERRGGQAADARRARERRPRRARRRDRRDQRRDARPDRDRRRDHAVWRRGIAAHGGRRRRGRRAGPPPRPAPLERVPLPAGVHRTDTGA